jgi:hypothetical protein
LALCSHGCARQSLCQRCASSLNTKATACTMTYCVMQHA